MTDVGVKGVHDAKESVGVVVPAGGVAGVVASMEVCLQGMSS